jgi:hypothetical protein
MLNLAVIGSGRGSNFQSILDAIKAGRIPARREAWPCACSLRREVKELFILNVSLRYILAAIAFGIAALGLFLL